MKHRKFTHIMALLAVLLFFIPEANLVGADSLAHDSINLPSTFFHNENQGCSNLDVVFIVDQSWAMSAPGTQEAVDPVE